MLEKIPKVYSSKTDGANGRILNFSFNAVEEIKLKNKLSLHYERCEKSAVINSTNTNKFSG